MDLRSYSKYLADIYIVSNTPLYLFETMRNSPIVSHYIAQQDTKDLIKEFSIRLSTSISDVSEIAEIYAIMIGLTFKKGSEVEGFFRYVAENIKFEWFSKIANYQLSNHAADNSNILNIDVTPPAVVQATNESAYKVIS